MFGEKVTTVMIQTPHRSLQIEAWREVHVHAPPIDRSRDSPRWERVREQALEGTDLGPDGPSAYLYPTPHPPGGPHPPITRAPASRRGSVRSCRRPAELMRRLHADFTFDSSATEVSTPAAEAFKARQGVCRTSPTS